MGNLASGLPPSQASMATVPSTSLLDNKWMTVTGAGLPAEFDDAAITTASLTQEELDALQPPDSHTRFAEVVADGDAARLPVDLQTHATSSHVSAELRRSHFFKTLRYRSRVLQAMYVATKACSSSTPDAAPEADAEAAAAAPAPAAGTPPWAAVALPAAASQPGDLGEAPAVDVSPEAALGVMAFRLGLVQLRHASPAAAGDACGALMGMLPAFGSRVFGAGASADVRGVWGQMVEYCAATVGNAAVPSSVKGAAAALSLLLALRRQRLADVLEAVLVLLTEGVDVPAGAVATLAAAMAKDLHRKPVLSPPTSDNLSANFTVSLDGPPSVVPDGSDVAASADGRFLFLRTEHGLTKVATGFRSASVPGAVLATTTDAFSSPIGFVACVGPYVLCPPQATSTTLNVLTADLAPHSTPSVEVELSLAAAADSTIVYVSDTRFLYAVYTPEDAGDAPSRVDKFDVLGGLEAATPLKAVNATPWALSVAALTSFAWCVNGATLMAVPKPSAPLPGFAVSFDLTATDAKLHAVDEPALAIADSAALVYSPAQNQVWRWVPRKNSLCRHTNAGLPPVSLPPVPLPADTSAAALGAAAVHHLHALAAPHVELAAISGGATPRTPASDAAQGRNPDGTVPLVQEPGVRTMAALNTLLRLCDAGKCDAGLYVPALRLLRANVVALVAAGGPRQLYADGDHQAALAAQVATARGSLMTVISTSTQPGVGEEAVATLSAGLEGFIPSGKAQVDLLVGLLSTARELTPAEHRLRGALMARMSTVPAALTLLKQVAPVKDAESKEDAAAEAESKEDAAGGDAVGDLFNSLLSITQEESEATLAAVVGAASDLTPSPTMAMLQTLFRCLLVTAGDAVVRGAPIPPSIWAVIAASLKGCVGLLAAARTALEASQFDAEVGSRVEAALLASAVGGLLPVALSALCCLGTASAEFLLGMPAARLPDGQHILAALLAALSEVHDGMAQAGLGEARTITTTISNTQVVTLESGHPYSNNENTYETVAVPTATSYVVAFDARTVCESGCDYLSFFTDDSHSSTFGQDRYSGRTDWPGAGGNAPLRIDAPSFVLHWHTDGSNTEWGYHLKVTAHTSKVETINQTPPLAELVDAVTYLATLQAGLLARGPAPHATESDAAAKWLDSTLVAGGLPDAAPAAPDAFLEDVIAGREGSLGGRLAHLMRFFTPSDTGRDPDVNRAVAAAAAAALKLGGLVEDAQAFAKAGPELPGADALAAMRTIERRKLAKAAKPQPPKNVKDAWASVQDLRVLITQAAKAPAGADGGDDAVVLKGTAELVEARARFLLGLNAPPSRAALSRKRWARLAVHHASASSESDADSVASSSTTASDVSKWHSVVEEARAAQDLKQLLDFRAGFLDDATAAASTSVRAFCADVSPSVSLDVLRACLRHRTQVANTRAAGLEMVPTLLASAGTKRSLLWVVSSVSSAFAAIGLHPFARVNGCSAPARARLQAAFDKVLAAFGALLQREIADEAAAHQMDALTAAADLEAAASVGTPSAPATDGAALPPAQPQLSRFASVISTAPHAVGSRASAAGSRVLDSVVDNVWLTLFKPADTARLWWTRIVLTDDTDVSCRLTLDELARLWRMYSPGRGGDMSAKHVSVMVAHLAKAFEVCLPALVEALDPTTVISTPAQVKAALLAADVPADLCRRLDQDSDGSVSQEEFMSNFTAALWPTLFAAVAAGRPPPPAFSLPARAPSAPVSPRARSVGNQSDESDLRNPFDTDSDLSGAPRLGMNLFGDDVTEFEDDAPRAVPAPASVHEEADAQLNPNVERGSLVNALLKACTLRLRADDVPSLSSSGVLLALEQLLLGTHVDDVVKLLRTELASRLSDGDLGGLIASLREHAMYEPTTLASLCNARALGVLRAIMSCAPPTGDEGNLSTTAAKQFVAVLHRVLGQAPAPDAGAASPSPSTPSAATPTAPEAGAGAGTSASGDPQAGEVPLVPSTALLPLSLQSTSAATGAAPCLGAVVPHVPLSKQGWTIGCRLYWPREEQVASLASASVHLDANGNITVEDGGLVFIKGFRSLSQEDQQPQQFVGLRTLPGRALQAFMCAGGEELVSVDSAPVRPGRWTAATMTYTPGEAGGRLQLYVDGGEAAEAAVPARLLGLPSYKRVASQEAECRHPYADNMDEIKTVSIPGAVKFTITFDQRTSTEGTHDWMEFYKDKDQTEQYGTRYHGGRGGGSHNWPGKGDNEPLVITGTDSFVYRFHTDGSNNDWGYKFTVEAEISTVPPPEALAADPSRAMFDNLAPFHLGHPPSWVFDEAPAPVVLSDMFVCPAAAYDAQRVAARVAATRPQFSTARLGALLARRPDQAPDRMLDVLSFMATSVLPHPAARRLIDPSSLLGLVLPLVFPAPGDPSANALLVRIAAARSLRGLLATTPLAEVNAAAAAACGATGGLADLLLSAVGSTLNVWSPAVAAAAGHPPVARPAAPIAFGMAQEWVALYRALIGVEPAAGARLVGALSTLPDVVSCAATLASAWPPLAEDSAAGGAAGSLQELLGPALASLAVLGGSHAGMFIGAMVMAGSDSAILLGVEPAAKLAVVSLLSAPMVPTRVPLATLTPAATPVSPAVNALFMDGLPSLSDALASVLLAGTTHATACLQPSQVPNPAQGAVADVQARLTVLLAAAVKQCKDPRPLAGLLPAVTAVASDGVVREAAAHADPGAEAPMALPTNLATLGWQASAALEGAYSVPRVPAIGRDPVVVVAGLTAKALGVKPPAKGARFTLPSGCPFAAGDTVALLDGSGATGTVVKLGEPRALDRIMVDFVLEVAVGGKPKVVPATSLRLLRRPEGGGGGEPAKPSAGLLHVEDSLDPAGDAPAEAFDFGATMERSRNRAWGFAVGTMRYAASKFSAEVVGGLLGVLAAAPGGCLPLPVPDMDAAALLSLVTSLHAVATAAPRKGDVSLEDQLFEAVKATVAAGAAPGLLHLCASQVDVAAKLAMLEAAARPPVQTRVVESPHQYSNNMDEDYFVKFPGAVRLEVFFDSRTRTESGCDWLRVHDGGGSQVGDQMSGTSWPMEGSPLTTTSDNITAHFHTDGSNVDWGFKMFVRAHFPPKSKDDMPTFPDVTADTPTPNVNVAAFVLRAMASSGSEALLSTASAAALADVLTSVGMYVSSGVDTALFDLLNLAQTVASASAILLREGVRATAALRGLHESVMAALSVLLDAESKSVTKSAPLQALVNAASAMEAAMQELENEAEVLVAAVEAAAAAGESKGDDDDGESVVSEAPTEAAPPAVVLGKPFLGTSADGVTVPFLLHPNPVPFDAAVGSMTVHLAGSGTTTPQWQVRSYRFNPGTKHARLVNKKNIVVDVGAADRDQIVVFDPPLLVKGGHYLAITCKSRGLNIATKSSNGGVKAYFARSAPTRADATLSQERRAKFYGFMFSMERYEGGMPPDAAPTGMFSKAIGAVAAFFGGKSDPVAVAAPLEPFAGAGGAAGTPRSGTTKGPKDRRRGGRRGQAGKKAATPAAKALTPERQAANEVVAQMTAVRQLMASFKSGQAPLQVLRNRFQKRYAASRRVVLSSTPAFDGKQLEGARPGGGDHSDSKADAAEAESKTASGDDFLRVRCEHATSLRVVVNTNTRIPETKSVFYDAPGGEGGGGKLLLRDMGAAAVTYECAHPYENNMDTYKTFYVPGAAKLRITFDEATQTENSCDYVRFYQNESHGATFGEERYTGGLNGSSKNYPGVGGKAPLVVDSNKVVVHFHSDGSNVAWGFKLFITPIGLPPAGAVVSGDTVHLRLKDHTDSELRGALSAANLTEAEYAVPDGDEEPAGYTITVEPSFPDGVHALAFAKSDFERFLGTHAAWAPRDEYLLEAAVATAYKRGINDVRRMDWEAVAPRAEDTASLDLFAALGLSPDNAADMEAAAERFSLLMEFNTLVGDVLPYVDLMQYQAAGSVANLISSSRALVLPPSRIALWEAGVKAATGGGNQFGLSINRMKAIEFAATGGVDVAARETVFSQAFRIINDMPPSALRRPGQLWTVSDTGPDVLYGLDAIDQGGPYRGSYSTMISEVQSPSMSLLVPVANARLHVGANRDMFVPNPAASSQVEVELFGFLGKLMGIAARNKEHLDLRLPSLVWKLLCGEGVTIDDLRAVDANAADIVESLRAATPEDPLFRSGLCFTATSATGANVDLVPGGARRPVTFDNRLSYADLLLNFRLHEFDAGVAAIKAGFACLVPVRVLCLFKWTEVEELVCGAVDIDLAMLRESAVYGSSNKDEPHFGYFWAALETFSQADLRRLIKFAYGRSKLPRAAHQLQHPFKLTTISGSEGDHHHLPKAHTCFFHIELPRFNSVENAREKLLIAIRM